MLFIMTPPACGSEGGAERSGDRAWLPHLETQDCYGFSCCLWDEKGKATGGGDEAWPWEEMASTGKQYWLSVPSPNRSIWEKEKGCNPEHADMPSYLCAHSALI